MVGRRHGSDSPQAWAEAKEERRTEAAATKNALTDAREQLGAQKTALANAEAAQAEMQAALADAQAKAEADEARVAEALAKSQAAHTAHAAALSVLAETEESLQATQQAAETAEEAAVLEAKGRESAIRELRELRESSARSMTKVEAELKEASLTVDLERVLSTALGEERDFVGKQVLKIDGELSDLREASCEAIERLSPQHAGRASASMPIPELVDLMQTVSREASAASANQLPPGEELHPQQGCETIAGEEEEEEETRKPQSSTPDHPEGAWAGGPPASMATLLRSLQFQDASALRLPPEPGASPDTRASAFRRPGAQAPSASRDRDSLTPRSDSMSVASNDTRSVTSPVASARRRQTKNSVKSERKRDRALDKDPPPADLIKYAFGHRTSFLEFLGDIGKKSTARDPKKHTGATLQRFKEWQQRRDDQKKTSPRRKGRKGRKGRGNRRRSNCGGGGGDST